MFTDRLGSLDTLRGPHVGVIEPGSGLDPRALAPSTTQALRRAVVGYGGLLLRGFPLHTPQQFRDFADAFLNHRDTYFAGTSQRRELADRVYNTTDAPADVMIEQHLESTHTPHPPRFVLFHCQVAPRSGGETTLASFAELAERLPAALLDQMRGQNVAYIKTLMDRNRTLYRWLPERARQSLALSWQEATGADSVAKAATLLEQEGYEVTRLSKGSLRTRFVRPLLEQHPATGTWVWRLSAAMTKPLPRYARGLQWALRDTVGIDYCLESGAALDATIIGAVQRAIDKIRFSFTWRPGDLLILDNEQMSHGRNPFTGERLSLASFGA